MNHALRVLTVATRRERLRGMEVKMTVNLELTPELSERLKAEADRRGVATEQVITDVLQDKLPHATDEDSAERNAPDDPRSRRPITREERDRAFQAFLDACEDIDVPDIPDEFLRREHLYEDRGL